MATMKISTLLRVTASLAALTITAPAKSSAQFSFTGCASARYIACASATIDFTSNGSGTDVLYRFRNLEGASGVTTTLGPGYGILASTLLLDTVRDPSLNFGNGGQTPVTWALTGGAYAVGAADPWQAHYGLNGIGLGLNYVPHQASMIAGCEPLHEEAAYFVTCGPNAWVEMSFFVPLQITQADLIQRSLVFVWTTDMPPVGDHGRSAVCDMVGNPGLRTCVPIGTTQIVPEPRTFALVFAGLFCIAISRRRNTRMS